MRVWRYDRHKGTLRHVSLGKKISIEIRHVSHYSGGASEGKIDYIFCVGHTSVFIFVPKYTRLL